MTKQLPIFVLLFSASCSQIFGIEAGTDRAVGEPDQQQELVPECVGPADCPGEETSCRFRTCDEQKCGIGFVEIDTPVFEQVDGDCLQVVCDGAGATTTVVADSDVPEDANECTEDVCIDGVPSNPPSPIDSPCGNELLCNGVGSCVGCNDALDCGTDSFCQTYSCDAAGVCDFVLMPEGTPLPSDNQTANDCQVVECNIDGQAVNAADNADLPLDDGLECTAQACVNGAPDYPAEPTNTRCTAGGTYCDGAGTCVDCNLGSQCSAPACQRATCDGNVCGTENVDNGTPCTDGTFCNGTETCTNGTCTNSTGDPCPGADGDGECDESCNESTDDCSANDPNGSVCDDGFFCTGSGMTCTSGACSGGTGNPCPGPDGDADCSEVCNESARNCTTNDPDGAMCSSCPSGQISCESGMCSGGNCAGTFCVQSNQDCP